jgi:hypothetical protein
MSDYYYWRSLRELDESAGLAKGSAFRAFKSLLGELREGEDFLVLDHQSHAALASQLHGEGRLYRSSVHPVLLAPGASARVAERLATATTGQ